MATAWTLRCARWGFVGDWVCVMIGAMIPQGDLDRAIDRWKARQNGEAVDDGGYAVEGDATVVGEHSEIAADSGMIAVSDDDLENM